MIATRNATSLLPLMLLSSVAAILLSVVPLPVWVRPARPDWLVLLVVYWVMHDRAHFGMLAAWSIGLMYDGVSAGVLGAHALGLAVVAYIIEVLGTRFALFAIAQQTAVVFALVTLNQLLCKWAQSLGGYASADWLFIFASFSTAMLWPLLMLGERRMSMIH